MNLKRFMAVLFALFLSATVATRIGAQIVERGRRHGRGDRSERRG